MPVGCGEILHLSVYEVELRQVFQNLIVNAIKFRSGATPLRIEIRSKRTAAGWQFSVADNGIGIDPVHFERMFDMSRAGRCGGVALGRVVGRQGRRLAPGRVYCWCEVVARHQRARARRRL